MHKQILIADDSEIVRDVLKMYLETQDNLQVCGEAADGLEAVEQAKKLKPDLVLLDSAFPMMNGAVAASVLKKLMPNMPIIIFSMYSEEIGRSLVDAIGVDVVLSKPDGMRTLMEAIRKLTKADHPDISV